MTNMKKILLVEDDCLCQELAVMIFKKLNCCIITADNGAQAIEKFHQDDYDLIFMDLGLPDIDGLTVTETLRNTEKCKNIPIVALTANTDLAYQSHCLGKGMQAVVQKPLTVEKAAKVFKMFICI